MTAYPSRHERLSRQVPVICDDGQEQLGRAKVVVAGAGGLGGAIATYLASAGIGFIRIVDDTIVEGSMLSGQTLCRDQDIGTCRALAAERAIHAFARTIRVEAVCSPIDRAGTRDLVRGMDLILDGLDNFSARYVLNRAAIDEKIPFIHGAVHGFYGQVTTIVPRATPCLRCIVPNPPGWENIPIIGVTCGAIGCIQATEAIKYLTGIGESFKNRLLLWDGLRGEAETIAIAGSPACIDCGTRANETNGR